MFVGLSINEEGDVFVGLSINEGGMCLSVCLSISFVHFHNVNGSLSVCPLSQCAV